MIRFTQNWKGAPREGQGATIGPRLSPVVVRVSGERGKKGKFFVIDIYLRIWRLIYLYIKINIKYVCMYALIPLYIYIYSNNSNLQAKTEGHMYAPLLPRHAPIHCQWHRGEVALAFWCVGGIIIGAVSGLAVTFGISTRHRISLNVLTLC